MSDRNMTHLIMQIHLSSWRYFAALTLPPLLLIFNFLYSLWSVALLALFLITHYYCWRLWLDERLFQLLIMKASWRNLIKAWRIYGR